MKKQKSLFSTAKTKLVAAALFTVFVGMTSTATVHADISCVSQGEKTSFKWSSSGCATTGDLINTVVAFFSALVGIAVVGGIIYGGLLYATANGNSSKTQQGISVIVNAIIGLLLYIFLFALTNFLVPGGIIG